MRYTVVLIHTEEGIAVDVPALPGCSSQGTTAEEAMTNIRDAAELYLSAVKEMNSERYNYQIEIREMELD